MAHSRGEKETGSPSFLDRLLAALLAPIFFNVSALVMAAVYLRRHPFVGPEWRHLLDMPRLVLLFTVVAGVVGFIWGTRGFADFLGHAFYTHTERRRNALITASIWGAIVILAYDLSAIF